MTDNRTFAELCPTGKHRYACSCASITARQRDRANLIAAFTEVLDRYLEATRERDQLLSQNMLMKPNKRRDPSKLEARVTEKRATLIEAYTIALGD